MTNVEHIAQIPMFDGLSPDQHRELGSIALEKAFARGTTIFSEGDPGSGFYVAISGRVKIFKLSADGKEQILHIFGPGEPFGEVPVFEGRKFPAHASALEHSVCLYFPRPAFIELIKGNPSLALAMLGVLSRRLRTFTVLVDNLSLKEVPGRLAAHLLYLSESMDGTDSLDLDISKGQLAALLGTIPETLSRILGRMVKQGLIESVGPRVKLLDREGLEELAEGVRRL
ncbi:MAG: Crp/Fnr family transcriptional regulator [Desulfomonilaceae bacterium]|nr:Crp/Fnr family transcriptional regulator [Desulfomonilaceae bacterium]